GSRRSTGSWALARLIVSNRARERAESEGFSLNHDPFLYTQLLCNTKRDRMDSYDAVVVGAGLAGLQSTRILAGHGLRVLLVDRKQSLDEGIHTTGIFVRRSLEDFALPAAHLGPAIRHVTVYSPRRRSL